MLKPTLFLLLGIAAGALTVTLWSSGPDGQTRDSAAGSPDLAVRVEALERALDRETLRRAQLEGSLAAIREQIAPGVVFEAEAEAEVETAARIVPAERASERSEDVEATGAPAPGDFGRRRIGRGTDEDLTARLVEAGFSPDRADYINARTETLRMEALQAQYEARRDGVPLSGRGFGAQTLRDELGESEYERYLQAVGRPTSVRVDGVLASSPAAHAGLAPGDEVVAYAGRRVFDMRDLNELILEGRPGEPVSVDVLRDGQPIQLQLPRGPLGISGRGRR